MTNLYTTLSAFVISSYESAGCGVTTVAFFCSTRISVSVRASARMNRSWSPVSPTVSVRPMNPCFETIPESRSAFSAPTI